MPDRLRDFLAAAGWGDAERTPLAGDMSPRRYSRLTGPRGSGILMDADDPQTAFLGMTEWLRNLGLSAPKILAEDAGNSLLILEDLGDLSLTRLLSLHPDRAASLYADCVDLLIAIRRAPPPALARPDAAQLVSWTDLARHYPGADDAGLAPFRTTLQALLSAALAEIPTVSLRDFHADNLMWLPDRHGIGRFGLLDYQDAFLTHPCYDLVSLTTDARTEVSPALRETAIAAWLDRTGDAEEPFRRAFAAYSAQRNLRILGLFSRAGRRLDAVPRVYRYFRAALDHPAFDDVRDDTLAALPEPRP